MQEEQIIRMIQNFEQERETYVRLRDEAAAEIAKLDAAIEGLRPFVAKVPHHNANTQLVAALRPAVALAERKASWIAQPPDSYPKRRGPGPKTVAVEPPAQPDHGVRPEDVGEDWVSLIASQASPFALALAYLRDAPSPFTSSQLNAALVELRGIKGGAGYTTLEPLQKAGVIEGSNNTWSILDRSRGGIISNGFLWSSPNNLNIYDWAVMRREALILLLREHPEGLRASEITKTLMSCEWLKSPVDPYLIKGDLRQLEAKGITEQDLLKKTWSLKK